MFAKRRVGDGRFEMNRRTKKNRIRRVPEVGSSEKSIHAFHCAWSLPGGELNRHVGAAPVSLGAEEDELERSAIEIPNNRGSSVISQYFVQSQQTVVPEPDNGVQQDPEPGVGEMV
jgi:hypothetical protein